jgi:hypothetical protein
MGWGSRGVVGGPNLIMLVMVKMIAYGYIAINHEMTNRKRFESCTSSADFHCFRAPIRYSVVMIAVGGRKTALQSNGKVFIFLISFEMG